MTSDSRTVYATAVGWFVELVARIDGEWDAPALGVWSRRDLVGHTSRAMLTVETYLRDQPGQIEAASPVDYFVRTRAMLADPEAVAARGKAAGEALGDDPAAAVAETAARVLALVAAAGDEAYVETPVADMWLADYLPTRTFELAVHTADLATALGLPPHVPPTAAAEALHLVADLAVAGGRAGPLLLAATGRGPVPPDFSVL